MGWQPGKQLKNGYYTIQRKLGEGGFSVTYLATTWQGRQVVIKTPNGRLLQHPNASKFRRDFLTEADLLLQCQHRHIVKVLELIPEDGMWGIVMEYIEGDDLANLLEARQSPIPEPEALKYIHQVGAALTVVHSKNLLHRDIKPSNIMIRADTQEAVLIDFGIAREFTPDLTQTLTQFHTPRFAPIEQEFASRGKWTEKLDLYALAATLYNLITNRLPEKASERENAQLKYQKDLLIPPKDLNPWISPQVSDAVMCGMAIEPQDRPATLQAWLNLLPDYPPEAAGLVLQCTRYPSIVKTSKQLPVLNLAEVPKLPRSQQPSRESGPEGIEQSENQAIRADWAVEPRPERIESKTKRTNVQTLQALQPSVKSKPVPIHVQKLTKFARLSLKILSWSWLILSFVMYGLQSYFGVPSTLVANRPLDLGLAALITQVNLAAVIWKRPASGLGLFLYLSSVGAFLAGLIKLKLAVAVTATWGIALLWGSISSLVWNRGRPIRIVVMSAVMTMAVLVTALWVGNWAGGGGKFWAIGGGGFWAISGAGMGHIFGVFAVLDEGNGLSKLHSFLLTSCTTSVGLWVGWLAAVWPVKPI